MMEHMATDAAMFFHNCPFIPCVLANPDVQMEYKSRFPTMTMTNYVADMPKNRKVLTTGENLRIRR